MQKYTSELKKDDLVKAHGGIFRITKDARPSTGHGTRSWNQNTGFTYYPEAPDCAIAEAICIEGEFPGYFKVGSDWTFQSNFKAGKYTLVEKSN